MKWALNSGSDSHFLSCSFLALPRPNIINLKIHPGKNLLSFYTLAQFFAPYYKHALWKSI